MIEGPSSEVENRDIPDVPLENFVAFERPDVRLENFVVFERPDVRLNELTVFQTIPDRRKGALREWIESLAFTVIFVLVFTTYIAQATQVPTESMKPTILVGDHFFSIRSRSLQIIRSSFGIICPTDRSCAAILWPSNLQPTAIFRLLSA